MIVAKDKRTWGSKCIDHDMAGDNLSIRISSNYIFVKYLQRGLSFLFLSLFAPFYK